MDSIRFSIHSLVGVPLVVMPITYEQPAIAQRVGWVGAGETIPVSRVNASLLRARIPTTVLGNPEYAQAAKRVAEGIRAAGGVRRACELIENVGRSETESSI